MTACCGSHLPVKSSVYNQTGENFFQQLGVYNHMNTHLRRVFQAKCIVDSKNPRYVQRHDNYNYFRRGKCLHKCQSHDNISTSARDSQYQLIDMLKSTSGMNKGSTKSLASFKSQNYAKSKNSMHSRRNPLSRQEIHESKPSVHVVEPKRSNDYTNDHSDYESSFEASTNVSDHRFSPSKSQKYLKNKIIKQENLKYLKFLQEITQEIIKNGVHKDEDIKNIFKQHFKDNLSILSKKKMLKKLQELKSSLNISDSEDDHDEEEESNISSVKSDSLTEKNEDDVEESKKSDKSDDNKYDYDSDDSNASQESIESQSEIESVINEDDSSSDNINPSKT